MSIVPTAPRQALHVSVSQIQTWLRCPRKFSFRYVLGAEPEHVSSNLVLGSAVHAALAAYYVGVKNGDAPGAEELAAAFGDEWDGEVSTRPNLLLPDGKTADDVKDLGVRMLTAFADAAAPPDEVVAVEMPFALDIADPESGAVIEEQLVGVLDAIVVDGGVVEILEHKTAARRWSQIRLDHDLQLSVYLGVVEADRLRVNLLLKTRAPELVTCDVRRTAEQVDEAMLIVCRVLDAIRLGLFWPNRDWHCRDCEFRRRCQVG